MYFYIINNTSTNQKPETMKTLKMLAILGLVLIVSAGTLLAGQPQTKNQPILKKARVVTYVVRIDNQSDMNLAAGYRVMITDPAGNLVAPPKPFVPGITHYTFYEGSPVDGFRTASLVKYPSETGAWVIPPVTLCGEFQPGAAYLFNIVVNPPFRNAGKDSE
jgi:hypothetical protein